MDQIEHKHLHINGLKLHVAEVGTGPIVVVFLHGFPEIWYSWRHQMIAVAKAEYRAIAPDWRGYGLSEQPPQIENASYLDLVDDLLAILDSLAIPKAFLVSKDFGVLPANLFTVLHPERVSGLITMGIPLFPPVPSAIRFDLLPKGFYVIRWQEPGRAEADFGRFDTKTVVRNIYILFCRSELQVAGDDQEIMDLVDPANPLPSWFTEEDLDAYSALYHNSGFSYPLQMPYRSWMREAIVKDAKIEVPAMLIMGEKDYALKFPGFEDSIRSGKVKEYAPDLEVVLMPEGIHFVQEQLPDEINQLLLNFVAKHI
ncbi:hypothetical protein H6P81_016852 [Aristolochia fimbriata]|uniref:AB hydrolase-1 domain-containing protein n=1 Tax=Aristolochia fimbriata TaxID=158543 RepID=A0AAV7DXD2_ARIFI|nr:hypothetical protein H6P81_016852 [Aristolochia fimbriata]